MPDIWGVAAIVAKFALYLGVFTSAGTVFAAGVFSLKRCFGIALTFAVVGLCGAVLTFVVRGANLTGDASGLIDLDMLALLWTTSAGPALTYRIVGLCLLVFGLLLEPFAGRIGLWISTMGGITAIWSFGQIGHVAGRNAGLMDIALMLHLIAVALWIGILTPLRRLASTRSTWPLAVMVGHRFGRIASFTVPCLIIVGGYMAYELVGSVSALFRTGYGQALMLKVLLVVGLIGLAATNKLRFIPGLRAKDPKAADHLVKTITVEWMVILVILGVTAVLTTSLTLPT